MSTIVSTFVTLHGVTHADHDAAGVRCMIIRGGSSKGAYFLADDLPADLSARDDLLRRIVGSPDPRQVDGIGGAHPLTSKVAIVAPAVGDADIEYLFLQVGVDTDVVTDRQNCGNLLAGVGPFAVERGLVTAPADGEAELRVLMRNTNSLATARFAMANGQPIYDGDTAISGVPGTAAAIRLDFEDLAGSSTGALLATGDRVNVVAGIDCTLIDNGMPVVVMGASQLGISGHETPAELEANDELRTTLEAVRLEAGQLMGLGDVSDTTIPKLTIVSGAADGGDLCTRTFIPHRCHDAIGVLGAISVATACRLTGAVGNELLGPIVDDVVRLEHPTGFFDAVVSVTETDGDPTIGDAGIVRTARKLMDGVVFPRPPDNCQN